MVAGAGVARAAGACRVGASGWQAVAPRRNAKATERVSNEKRYMGGALLAVNIEAGEEHPAKIPGGGARRGNVRRVEGAEILAAVAVQQPGAGGRVVAERDVMRRVQR